MFSGWGCKIAYRVMQDVNKGRQAKEEKKSKPSKKEHKGKKERKRSASPSSPLRQFPLLDTETLRFYRGKPCALLALSYETDPPHAIIRTADGREVGVEMDQLSEAPQQRKKRKKQKKEKGEAGEAAVVTIDCSSASPSPERGAAGASGADPAEAAPAAEAAEEAAARRGAASEASPAAASEEAAEGSAPAAAVASGGGGAPSPAASAEAAEAADDAVAEGVAEPAEAAASAEAAEAAPPAAPRGSEAGGPALGRGAAAAETAEAATATPAGAAEAAEASPESAEAAAAAAEAVAAAEAARARAPSARSERQEVPAEAKPQQQRSRPPPQPPPPDTGRRERGAAGRRATAAEGREAAAVGEGAEEAAVGPGVAGPGDGSRRLAESALYREDVLAHGHSEVWGSWFDAESQRWGYRCCRGLVRAQPCACERRHAAEPSAVGTSDGPSAPGAETAESSETGVDGLQPRESFPDAVGYVMHWVRAVLHDWKEALHRSVPEVVAHERFGTGQQLGEAERAVAPLLRLLEACSLSFSLNESVQVWSVGNNKWMNGKVVEVLASESLVPSNKSSSNSSGNLMPAGSVLVSFNSSEARKWVSGHSAGTLLRKPSRISLSKQAIEKLESIASLSAQREYHAANQAYIELTLGHSRWHGDLSISGLTGSNKAPRNGFKVKRDQGNFLDTEEAKVYMFCLKRLVSFLQLIRPNADVSKHCT